MIKAKIEADKKNKNSVIGRILSGDDRGKIVFFNSEKPEVGQFVLIEESEDKGRFLVAKKWRLQGDEERVAALLKLMEGRIRFSESAEKFRIYHLGLVENFGQENFVNAFIEGPAEALRLGINGNQELLEKFRQFKKNISGFSDMVAERAITFLDASEETFKKGGGPSEAISLPEFQPLANLLIEIGRKRAWPIRGVESGVQRDGYRYFCPTE